MTTQYAICISNQSYPASLIVGKVYRVLPDEQAEALDMLRVIDEDFTETDGYLYPNAMFAAIGLPEAAQRTLETETAGHG